MRLNPIDFAVLVVYLAATILVGLRFSRRSRSSDHYFLGGRDFPGWAIGLSFIGSLISSITFLAYPADSFKTAWLRILPPLAFPVAVLAACYAFLPVFRRAGVTSAYHYLALRFGPAVSVYAAVVYLAGQIVRAASITYLIAVLAASLTRLPVLACILLSAGATAVYTIKGGFEAVVWTDVVQTLVLMCGAVVCVACVVSAVPGGLPQIFREAWSAGKLSLRDLNVATGRMEATPVGFSLTQKSVVMLVLVGFVNYLTGLLDQHSVQRWCAARSDREARKAMLVLGVGALPIWIAFMFLGTCLWVYYRHVPADLPAAVLAGRRKAEDILPYFILTVVPRGLGGLVISAAVAAAMASLSSCINAASMVWVGDIYRKYLCVGRPDAHYLAAAKLTTLALSAATIGGAYVCYVASTKTILDLLVIGTSVFGGGIPALFAFGIFTRWGDSRAVLLGIAIAGVFTVYALLAQVGAVKSRFDPYYTSIFSNLTMLAGCGLGAALFRRRCS